MTEQELRQWTVEKDRLQLAVAAAVQQLWSHMGNPESMCMPWNGAYLQISKVKQGDLR